MEKTYFIRTIMEIQVKAKDESEAKSKAIESFKYLDKWVPITPFALMREDYNQLYKIQQNLQEMEKIIAEHVVIF